jgi:hypothetical protein
VKARRAKSNADYQAKLASERERESADAVAAAEQKRRADCFDDLVAVLEAVCARLEIHMTHTEDLIAHMNGCKALAKAKQP